MNSKLTFPISVKSTLALVFQNISGLCQRNAEHDTILESQQMRLLTVLIDKASQIHCLALKRLEVDGSENSRYVLVVRHD